MAKPWPERPVSEANKSGRQLAMQQKVPLIGAGLGG